MEKMPNSQTAEIALLGCILWKGQLIKRIDSIITPNDFFNEAHKIIFDCMLKLDKENKEVGFVFLQIELNNRDQLEQIGGIGYLIKLQEDIVDTAFIEKYAQIIKEKSLMRDFITLQLNNISYCQNIGSKNVDNLFDEIEKSFLEFSKKRQSNVGYQLNFLMRKTFNHLSQLKDNDSGLTGVPSGYESIDKITSGFQKTDLIILAARPSMGKTSLAMNIAVNSAKQGYSVGILSLEMSSIQLCIRMISTESGIDQQFVRNNTGSEIDNVKITNAAADLAELKIWVEDNGSLNIMNIRSIARGFKLDHKMDLLVIDYLQLINSIKRNDSRVNEISDISRALKALAKELDLPIICLSQLSRKCEERVDKRPLLSDLRDSGAIEQDADIVMFIYRDVVYNQEANPNDAEIIIAKHRNGRIDKLNINFDPTLTKFYER